MNKLAATLFIFFALAIAAHAYTPAQNYTKLGAGADGACNNDNDLSVFNTTKDSFHASVQACAKKCYGEPTCATKCIVSSLKLSQECATCFGTAVGCTAKNCLFDCMSNPNSDKCLACALQNCEPALLTCTGVSADIIPH